MNLSSYPAEPEKRSDRPSHQPGNAPPVISQKVVEEVEAALEAMSGQVRNPLGANIRFDDENLARLILFAANILRPGQMLEQDFLRRGTSPNTTRARVEDAFRNRGFEYLLEQKKISIGFQGVGYTERTAKESGQMHLTPAPLTFSIVVTKRA